MNLRYEIPQRAEFIKREIRTQRLPEWFEQLDHIAIKAANTAHFDQVINELKSGTLLRPFSVEVRRITRAEMDDRRIDVAELAGRLAAGMWVTTYFEVIEPRPAMVGKFKAGVDHFEYLAPIPLKDIENRLEQVSGIMPVLEQKPGHNTLCFNLGGQDMEVKFTDKPLRTVLEEELRQAEAYVTYEDL